MLESLSYKILGRNFIEKVQVFFKETFFAERLRPVAS